MQETVRKMVKNARNEELGQETRPNSLNPLF